MFGHSSAAHGSSFPHSPNEFCSLDFAPIGTTWHFASTISLALPRMLLPLTVMHIARCSVHQIEPWVTVL